MSRLRNIFKRSHKLESAPLIPSPSEIADWAASAPKSIRKQQKMALRRQYRSPLPMSSNQRQILAEACAPKLFVDLERQAKEDERYGTIS